MILNILKTTLYILTVIGWLFFFLIAYLAVRWNEFANRNPDAQDIMNEMIINLIFKK